MVFSLSSGVHNLEETGFEPTSQTRTCLNEFLYFIESLNGRKMPIKIYTNCYP
jgi:hypothetical protein